MTTIFILPEILSNKIAAGEVVERPASVVKELTENAIDAGSTRIHIEIEQGGRSLIRVSDNGKGMSADDALLSIERYATSKLKEDKDLFSIHTLGFRGEALPSIASVSHFTLITRDSSSAAGTKIVIQGGKIKDVTEVGAPVGAQVSVGQLFFNTPARRKFLKSVSSEAAHIADTLSTLAMGWPQIQFTLSHNGKTVKTWAQAKDPFLRAVDILGNETRPYLRKIEYHGNGTTLSGWVSDPLLHRSTSQKIYILVNGRAIRDRGLQHALFEGYRGRLVKGRFPLAVIQIDTPPDQVDVNVHPAKHEVRFADKNTIYRMVIDAVYRALSLPEQKSRGAHEKPSFSETPLIQEKEIVPPTVPDWEEPGQKRFYGTKEPAPPPFPDASLVRESLSPSPATPPWEEISADHPERPLVPPTPPFQQKSLFEEDSFFKGLRILGQFKETYIVCESREELILIDQHAAHERIYYEKLKRELENAVSLVQTLLIPETLELNFREADLLEKMIPELKELGIEIEPFGGNTFIVKSVPALLSDRAIGPMVVELVEKRIEGDFSGSIEEKQDQCLMVMACHTVVRARQSLSDKEIRALLIDLDACDAPSFCPHGRPTFIRWSKGDIEKRFGRIV